MGLIRDLIGNFAQARAQEAKQKGDEQAQLADIYKFVYQNSPDPQQQQRALQDWMAILGKHGGPQGKEMAEQLTPVLTGQAAVRNAKRMAQDGGMLPNYAGMTQREPAIPMAQTGQFQLPGQQTADWMSTPPASPAEAGEQAATAAAQKVYEQVGVRTASAAGARHGAREGARGFLRTLAHGAEGVGENLMGMPRAQRGAGIDPNIQIPTAEQMQQRQLQGQDKLQEQRRREGIAIGLKGDVLTRYILTGNLPPTFGEPERAGTATAAKLTEFKIPANATGDWAPYAGKSVRLWADPKSHEVWNAAGRQVTLPPGTDFAEPEKKLTKYEEDEQLWLALKAKEVGKDPKDLTKEEIYDAKSRGPLGTLGQPLYNPDTAPKPGVPGQRNEEALRNQPQTIVNIVKGLADYSYQVPSGFSLANPKGPFIKAMEVMKQYDPSFDASLYPMRAAIKKSYTSGKDWDNLKRINTLIGHLGRMQKTGAALGNIPSGTYGVATGAANWLRTMTMEAKQDPRLTAFNDDANAVESELAAVFKGTGAPSMEEIKAWRAKVNASSSPEELQTHIQEGVNLMMSRLDILKSGWEANMGIPFNIQFLSPESAKTLQALGGEAAGRAGATGGGGGGTVKMRAPNGDTQDVPADQVEHFKSLGATVVK